MRNAAARNAGVRFERLLAKSVPAGCAQSHHTLQGHTGMVVAAAHRLLDARGLASLRAVGLPDNLLHRLRRIVLVGAFAHDLGKCSQHFQEMVHGTQRVQLVRHEAATLWLAWPGRPLGSWLMEATGSREDLMLALCAAAGHHRKFTSRALAFNGEGAGTEMALLVDHPDFRRLLEGAASVTKLPFGAPPVLERCWIKAGREAPEAYLADWADECREVVTQEPALLAVAKALVLDADVAGSAISKSGETLNWISEALDHRATYDEFVGVVTERLDGGVLRPFQRNVAEAAAPVTLVVAGCGSGKTLAAYQWAAEQHPGRQLWVTYPTTGTATEGFRDYVADPELQLEASLEHSRAHVDLEILSPKPEDEEDHLRRERDRLEALRFWRAKVVTCTADTVLGLIQNQRRGLYAWAGLAHSAVVFDEIHAYDDRMFGALLRFLADIPGVPILLMTASLPAARRARLEALSMQVHGRALHVVRGPADLESIRRYVRVHSDDAWEEIESCQRNGGKVLYVCNTVDRCLAGARIAARRGLTACVYHSRFRYSDRVARHRDVVESFRRAGGALALTTQVAEMSLDLSADLLVTDLAPIPAMIQRLGRLHRRATPENPGTPKPFIVLENSSASPYEDAELREAAAWLVRLGASPLSQTDLVAAWNDEGVDVPEVASTWFDGGFRSEPGELREAGVGIQVLLASDAGAVRAGSLAAVAVALPMPPTRQKWLSWPRLDGYVVAPEGSIEYDERMGARWA